MNTNQSLSIIMPIFNEENTIEEILKKLKILKSSFDTEIIIINDGSTDKSKKIIEDNHTFYSKVYHLKNNQGKGKAVIEGLKHCTKNYVLIQDADLEYDPIDILKFMKVNNEFDCDLIMGSRFIGSERSVLNFWHMLGNKFITFIFNFLNNTTFSDIYCCYCLFKRKNLDFKKLKCNGWGQQAEILTHLINKNSRLFEIGVKYNGRKYSEGKKIKYYDVFSVTYWIVFTKIKKIFS
tara:strand:- start:834 stop:1541 length:708 start_codon:yes stop_codon:yes gene_type:complete